jgi:hypothetical protein
MADVVFIALLLAFFALCAALVVACDRLVGSDHEPLTSDPADQNLEVGR